MLVAVDYHNAKYVLTGINFSSEACGNVICKGHLINDSKRLYFADAILLCLRVQCDAR